MVKYYKVHTPNADEYRSAFFTVSEGDVMATSPGMEHFLGKKWDDVRLSLFSIWKLYSSKCNDNVYPAMDEIPKLPDPLP